MSKKIVSILVLVIWLIIIISFMLLARSVNVEIFFVLWLIGILIIIELLDSRYGRPRYLRFLTWSVWVGVLIFGVIVINKVLVILNS